jgi:hypothetical protein
MLRPEMHVNPNGSSAVPPIQAPGENEQMEAHRNRMKRWPGQPSIASDEILRAETQRELHELLKETERLRRRIAGEPAVAPEDKFEGNEDDPSPVEETAEDRPRSRLPEPPPSHRSRPSDPLGPQTRADPAGPVSETPVSFRRVLRDSRLFMEARELTRAALSDTLGYFGLYRLRDAVLANLGFAPEKKNGCGSPEEGAWSSRRPPRR